MLVHVEFGTRREPSPMNAGAALSLSSNCNEDEETSSESCDKSETPVADPVDDAGVIRIPPEPCASRRSVAVDDNGVI